eukprot:2077086-Amphidinium_carterae.1
MKSLNIARHLDIALGPGTPAGYEEGRLDCKPCSGYNCDIACALSPGLQCMTSEFCVPPGQQEYHNELERYHLLAHIANKMGVDTLQNPRSSDTAL